MFQHHKLISVCLGLLYMVVLQIFSSPQPVFRFLLPAFFGVLAVTYAYNRAYLRHLNQYNFWTVLRPALLQSSGFLIYLLLPGTFSRGVFFVASVFFLSVFESLITNQSENVILNQTLITAFNFAYGFFGFSQYFPSFGVFYLIGFFACAFLIARSFYEFIPHAANIKLLNALGVAFLSAQVFWAVSLLPFDFSALAILLFDFFYVLLVLNYYSLFHTLSLKKVKLYFGLAGVSLVIVFLATQWGIIN